MYLFDFVHFVSAWIVVSVDSDINDSAVRKVKLM